LDALAAMYRPKKVTATEICFADFAGRGGARAALDATLVAQIRDLDAFAVVLRGFPDAVGEAPAPAREFRTFVDELVLADLAVVEKRIERLKKEKGSDLEREILQRCHAALDAGRPLREMGLRPDEERLLAAFAFVSLRPLLAVLNVGEADIGQAVPADLAAAAAAVGADAMVVSGQVEMEVEELPAAERAEYLREIGIAEPARARFIQASYALLSLISFLTVGEDEVRAWPIRRGTAAVRAAGKIHSDIERGFIRAEVIRYEDLLRHGSEAKCRDAGALRAEGRDYLVQDGDVIHFRFAV
jgi:hypothetical protein